MPAPVPHSINFAEIVDRLERAGVDLRKELRIDRKTLWRWKVAETLPNGEHGFLLAQLVQRQAGTQNPVNG